MEDMRELHSSFCSLKASLGSGGKGNLAPMQELLHRCGVPPLDTSDTNELRSMLRPRKNSQLVKGLNPPANAAAAGGDQVSFATFLGWMRQIREIGIQGLAAVLQVRRGEELTLQDLEKRHGFHCALLKEQFYFVWERSQGADVDDCLAGAESPSPVSKMLSNGSTRSMAQDRRLPRLQA
mmetsp:Transcript_1332/g.2489  ORF Transcript_1332/g.2489 Transcript_1332/m.2489 type:complete len:180 (+) Transcript_1332:1-540(+)